MRTIDTSRYKHYTCSRIESRFGSQGPTAFETKTSTTTRLDGERTYMLLAATIWTGLFVSALGATLIGGSLSPKPTLKNKPKSPATKVFYRGALAR